MVNNQWLLNRLYETKDQPNVRFAFQGSVNWIRGLSMIADSYLTNENIKSYYSSVQRRTVNQEADTRSFSNILMSLHYLSALQAMPNNTNKSYDFVRLAVISWYYSIYNSSQAMIAAFDGSKPNKHSDTAKKWHELVEKKLIITPFSFCLDGIKENAVKKIINSLRSGNNYTNTSEPSNGDESLGCIYSYLSGTAKYERWRTEEKLRKGNELKKLNVTDFRTKKARELRDKKFDETKVNFLAQAIRYRGKANYRDSIYLAYGNDNMNKIQTFLIDLELTARKFLEMAMCYISCRVEKNTWQEFTKDLNENLQFSVSSETFTNNKNLKP